MTTITKAYLTDRVYHHLQQATLEQAKRDVNIFFARISSEILSRDSLLFSGFGRFNRRKKKERVARNMQNGQPAIVTARTVITFRSTLKMRRAINGDLRESIQPSVEPMYQDDYPRDRYAEAVAKIIMTEISNAMIEGNRVEIRGFGTFSARSCKGYTGRNPMNGEKIKVPAKILPHFKPSKALLRRANERKR